MYTRRCYIWHFGLVQTIRTTFDTLFYGEVKTRLGTLNSKSMQKYTTAGVHSTVPEACETQTMSREYRLNIDFDVHVWGSQEYEKTPPLSYIFKSSSPFFKFAKWNGWSVYLKYILNLTLSPRSRFYHILWISWSLSPYYQHPWLSKPISSQLNNPVFNNVCTDINAFLIAIQNIVMEVGKFDILDYIF